VVLGFDRAYFGTVTCADAYPDQPCPQNLVELLNLEMWGLPISGPALDPADRQFAYQSFQRGVLQMNMNTDLVEAVLLADWWKSLITGEILPPDLEQDAREHLGGGSTIRQTWRRASPGRSCCHPPIWWRLQPRGAREPLTAQVLFDRQPLAAGAPDGTGVQVGVGR
jgi:hypothetical protein